MPNEDHQVVLGIQVKKNAKGMRVGASKEVFHMTIGLSQKAMILPGRHLVVLGTRRYRVEVDQNKNLKITRTV